MVGLGLGLPLVVRALGISEFGHKEADKDREAEASARRLAIEATREAFQGIQSEKKFSESIVALLETRHETRSRQIHEKPEDKDNDESAQGADLVRKLIGKERRHLHKMLRDGTINDETRRRIERDLDLEEAIITNREFVWKAR
jgi:hypothetical protein